MLEEVANIWPIGLRSFLDVSQFSPMVSNLWDKETFSVQEIDNTKVKKSDVLLGYLILLWVLLYLAYEKCLNVSPRRIAVPLFRVALLI